MATGSGPKKKVPGEIGLLGKKLSLHRKEKNTQKNLETWERVEGGEELAPKAK